MVDSAIVVHPITRLAVVSLVLVGSCQEDATSSDPIRFGDPVAAPVDQQITILPTASASSDLFGYIEPIAVGIELDAIVAADGSLNDYRLRGESFQAAIILTFASEAYFAPTHDDEQARQSCNAYGWWAPSHPAGLTAFDEARMYRDYEGTLELVSHGCHELLDPNTHGKDGGEFISRFDGIRVGLGFAPMTDDLWEGWPETIIDTWGSAMLAMYVAVEDADGAFIAQDISTTFATAVNEGSDDVLTDEAGLFIPLNVANWDPDVPLPRFYAYSIATWFLTLNALPF
ncbi:MAG: hypothetical protein ACI9OJ_002490 [Myxococcota bacterium]